MRYIKHIQLIILLFIFPLVGFSQMDSVISFQEINNLQGGLDSVLKSGDRFGTSVEVIGDVNHDGIDDIAVGAPYDDDSITDQGAVYILMLNEDGTVKEQQKISALAGNGPSFYSTHRFFGSGLAALGDLNGDGNVDLAVGGQNCGDDGVGGSGGAIYILFLDTDGVVLEYNKISDNQGGGNNFLGSNKFMGVSLHCIGDLDGDGVVDLVAGAHGDDDGGTNRGCFYILHLDYNGRAKKILKISDTQGGFTGTLDDSDFFGVAICDVGDMDGDGVIDLAVGATNDDDGGTDRGAVWICFMNTDGTVDSHQKISSTQGSFEGTLDDSDAFGGSLANLGDLDGDGVVELGVGATGDDDDGTNTGALWVLYLTDSGTVKSHAKIAGDKMGTEVDPGDAFMCAIASFGDRNKDGKIDLLAGAWNSREVNTCGEVYIMHMEDSTIYPTRSYYEAPHIITTVVKHSDVSGEPLEGELDANDVYSWGMANIGDLDGDGIEDLMVGADLDDDYGSAYGAVYVQFLNADGSIKNYQKISATQGGLGVAAIGGRSVTNMGDLDGNGITDVAVGNSRTSVNTGKVTILFLTDSGYVDSTQAIRESIGGFEGDLDNGDQFGYAVANIGDIDGDGIVDLAVGAYQDDDGNTNKGAIWILFMDSNGTVQSEQKISDTEGNFSGNLDIGDSFGFSVANVGDWDGNGINEIAVGAQKDDDGAADAGAVYILFLTDSGTVDSTLKISEFTASFDINFYNFDYFGKSIVGGYDFDMDGVNDLLVGARDLCDGGTDRGEVFILLMNADNTIKSHLAIGSTYNLLTGKIDNVDYFGCSLAVLDYDIKSQTAKIAVGAYNDDDGATNSGAVYVLKLDLSAISGGKTNYVYTPHAITKKKLDAGFYIVDSSVSDYLPFTYDEEYYTEGTLTFQVLDKDNTAVTNTQNLPVNIGDNRYTLDMSLFSGITTGYYTLELTNNKGENRYLRFKRN